MSERMIARDKTYWQKRETNAQLMIEKYGGYTLTGLLNLILELEEDKDTFEKVIREMSIEASERNQEIKELYEQIHLLKLS